MRLYELTEQYQVLEDMMYDPDVDSLTIESGRIPPECPEDKLGEPPESAEDDSYGEHEGYREE